MFRVRLVQDPGLIPGLGRSPGEGKSYSLQYSGLENSPWNDPMEGHKEPYTTEWLSLSLFRLRTGSQGKGFPGGSDLGSIHGLEDPLEKGMAIHSSILVWKISWTEGPGRLQSTGSERVGQD